ncbi:MAG TPA: hypothetical protein VM183_10880 [Burkholderiales bacterium]|nr:hypothetical protein [Burkholderiales bacterium]
MAWVYIGVVLGFELWLARRISEVGRAPVVPAEAPYHFSEDEARLISRYRFYFTYPAIARHASSTLSAVGLTALLLAPWLTYKHAFLPAAIIGMNLFAVARFTKMLVPLMPLRIAASRGDRDALLMLEVHDPAWAKIRAGNQDGGSKMQA